MRDFGAALDVARGDVLMHARCVKGHRNLVFFVTVETQRGQVAIGGVGEGELFAGMNTHQGIRIGRVLQQRLQYIARHALPAEDRADGLSGLHGDGLPFHIGTRRRDRVLLVGRRQRRNRQVERDEFAGDRIARGIRAARGDQADDRDGREHDSDQQPMAVTPAHGNARHLAQPRMHDVRFVDMEVPARQTTPARCAMSAESDKMRNTVGLRHELGSGKRAVP